VEQRRKPNLQIHQRLQSHQLLGYEIGDRFCDIRRGCGYDCEVSKIDDESYVRGCEIYLDEVNEIALAVGKVSIRFTHVIVTEEIKMMRLRNCDG
jgi:hypothetical protein